jgi:hypothetical protein
MNLLLHYVAMTALSFAALGALALSMHKHATQVQGGGVLPLALQPLPLRITGWAVLVGVTALCIRAEGVGIGLTALCAVLTAAAVPLILLFTYRPRRVPPLAMAAALVGLGLLVVMPL